MHSNLTPSLHALQEEQVHSLDSKLIAVGEQCALISTSCDTESKKLDEVKARSRLAAQKLSQTEQAHHNCLSAIASLKLREEAADKRAAASKELVSS